MVTTPEPLVIAGARERIRAAGRRIAVLDDDPTGSQTVHDVAIVTALDDDELRHAGDTTFFLTNTRSLPEADADALTERVARTLLERDPRARARQPQRLDAARARRGRGRAAIGRAGARARQRLRRRAARPGLLRGRPLHRATTSTGPATCRWARPSSRRTRRSATARRTCASSSPRSAATRTPISLSLEDIRVGGPERVAQVLQRRQRRPLGRRQRARLRTTSRSSCSGCARAGARFVYRTGPSFVRALAGLEPRAPLSARGHLAGRAARRPRAGGRRLARRADEPPGRGRAGARRAAPRSSSTSSALDVAGGDAGRCSRRWREGDVLLYTSRTLKRGEDADDSLAIARRVSTRRHRGRAGGAGGAAGVGDRQGRDHVARRRRARSRHPPRRGARPAAARHGVGVPAARGGPRARSGCRTWCSPATSATSTRWPRSSSGSAGLMLATGTGVLRARARGRGDHDLHARVDARRSCAPPSALGQPVLLSAGVELLRRRRARAARRRRAGRGARGVGAGRRAPRPLHATRRRSTPAWRSATAR